MHTAGSVDRWRARNQRVLEALMIPFPIVVIDEFRHGPAEVALQPAGQHQQQDLEGRGIEHEPGAYITSMASTCTRRRLSCGT
jgi:hypothetical protein